MFADIEILEFPKILQELRRFVVSDLAKNEVLSIKPTNNPLMVERMLHEVNEAKMMIERYDETPMTGVLNILDAINRAKIGSTLPIDEILKFVSFVEAEGRTKQYIKKVKTLEIDPVYLEHYYDEIVTHPHIKREIEDCIDSAGRVYDHASVQLLSIRKKIATNEKRIQEKMESLLRTEQSKLTDSIITIRNNRLVLPVKAEYKNSFKGILHDQSSSKETYFIEPLQCVDLNNKMQSLFIEEQEEIDKILYQLTQVIGQDAITLKQNLEILTSLDLIFGKAKYAIRYDHTKPLITKDTIELISARHPLIPQDKVVSNTIRFQDYHTIVITGPNTGGKTVALKTLGLLSVMVQSGLLIPVNEDSKTVLFSNIYSDIGDEQSIEQSLSTFSSHITKIIHILNHLQPRSLVLLDELGSGTDPKEGASLAISILDYIREKNVYSMVTTHYPELKVYAYDLEDTINASVEFDIETLRPTYKLQIGIPGTSNALDIASRLGLHEEIISHAKNVSMSFDNQTTNLIKKLEKQSHDLRAELESYHQLKQTLEIKDQELSELLAKTKIKQNQMIKDFEQIKIQEVEEAKKEALKLIEELDELKKTESFKEHELARIKHEVKSLSQDQVKYQKLNTKRIQVGDVVNVIPFQRSGIVMKQLSNQQYEIQMGVLSSVFKEKDLEFIKQNEKTQPKSRVTVSKESEARVELDLRGKRFEEAMVLLDKYIDDCLINNLEFAYIIHGYGTGALRKGVQEAIRKYKQIKSSRPGGMNEGGSGVTVIYFK